MEDALREDIKEQPKSWATWLAGENGLSRLHYALLFSAVAALLIMICLSERELFFDEPAYLNDAACVERFGWGMEMMRHMQGAAGPLFTWVHALAQPLTGFAEPGVRLVSWLFTLGTTLCLGYALRIIDPTAPLLSGLHLFLLPSVFISAGLAITEAPALGFLGISILAYTLMFREGQSRGASLALATVAGVAYGMAVFGRQTILSGIPAFLLILVWKKRWAEAFLFAAGSLPPAAIMYTAWGSLRPAFNDTIDVMHPHISLQRWSVTFGYLAVFVIMINPGLLRRLTVRLLAVFVVPLLLNVAFGWVSFLPMKFFVLRLLPWLDVEVAARVAGSALIGLATVGTWLILRELWETRHQAARAAFGLGALLHTLAAAAVGSTGRYLILSAALVIVALWKSTPVPVGGRLAQWAVLALGCSSIYAELMIKQPSGGWMAPGQLIYVPRLFEHFPNYAPAGPVVAPVRADQILDLTAQEFPADH